MAAVTARRAPRIPRRAAGFAIVASAVALGALSGYRLTAAPRAAGRHAEFPVAAVLGGSAGEVYDLTGALRMLASKLAPLRGQVSEGHIVPNFGAKAHALLADLAPEGGSQALRAAVDGALEALFLRQLGFLREKITSQLEQEASQDPAALGRLEAQFVAEAEDLVRPGSSWSYEPELAAFVAVAQGSLRREAALLETRARAARAHRATIGVISRLQGQMEMLQQKAQGMRAGGSPWVLSTSYRIPNTPLHVTGRYEGGRANVELNLTPAKGDSGSSGERLGPASMGVSFNLGI